MCVLMLSLSFLIGKMRSEVMPLDHGQGSEQTHEQALTAPEAMENSCSLSLCSLGALRGGPPLVFSRIGCPPAPVQTRPSWPPFPVRSR